MEVYEQVFQSFIFVQLFSDLTPKFEPIGKRLQDEKGIVNVYEAFAVFYAFSEGLFEEKIENLFFLFDFDCSGSIEFSEMFLAIQSIIFGMCRFLGLQMPAFTAVRGFAEKGFKSIDADQSET